MYVYVFFVLGAQDSEPATTSYNMTIQGDSRVYGPLASRMSVGHMEIRGPPEGKSEG